MDVDPDSLSQRRREVAFMVGMGFSKAETARFFHRSVKTVENEVHQVYERLNVRNRVELARWAIRVGLCPVRLRFAGRLVEAGGEPKRERGDSPTGGSSPMIEPSRGRGREPAAAD